MLIVRWKSDPSKGWGNLYPSDWFDEEGIWPQRDHLTQGPKGGTYYSRCAVHVSGRQADIAYGGAHAQHNAGHHFIGTVRITFVDESRSVVAQVEWRDDEAGAEFQREDVETIDFAVPLEGLDNFDPSNIEDGRLKIERMVVLRQGQKVFRDSLLAAYEVRCAISGCDVRQVLEAAHIMPYLGEETNRVRNGLLLRADLHTLFDLGIIKIDADYRIIAAANIVDAFNLPEKLGKFLPKNETHHPCREALAKKWAMEPA